MMAGRQRVRIAVEVLIGLGLIVSLFDTGTLLKLNPSPFFIVVLYGAWSGGTLIGVLTGLCASLLYLMALTINAFSLDVFWAYVVALPSHYLTPLFLLVAGFVFGEIRIVWERRLHRLQEQADLAQRETLALRERLQQAEVAIHELEGRVLGQTDTMTRLYEIAKNMNVLSVEQILIELLRVLEELLQVEQAGIYRIEATGEYARMSVRVGTPVWGNSLQVALHPALSQVLAAGKLLTWRAFEQRPAPMFLLPIFHGGRTYAVIAVHRLPVRKVSVDTAQLLRVLARWAGDSLERAAAYEQAVLAEATYAGTQVVRWAYFQKQCAVEQQRYRQYQIPYTVLEIEVETALGDLPAAQLISKLVQGKIRSFDRVAWEPQRKVAGFLFPTLERADAEPVRARLCQQFQAQGWAVRNTELAFNRCEEEEPPVGGAECGK